MAKRLPILFSKGKDSFSQSEAEEEDDDVWDDSKINDAYDRAMKIASSEVAKRLAMTTNTKLMEKETNSKIKKITKTKKISKPRKQWKAGMSCRAQYDKDGLEYEAIIQRIISDEECVVKFLGYNNSEIVTLSSLKNSNGVQTQAKQIEEAIQENGGGCDSSNSFDQFEDMNQNSNQRNSAQFSKTDFIKSSEGKKSNINFFELPEVPPMPNMSMMKNLGVPDIPMPPPPPMALKLNSSESEQQVISSMLLSWYMSGYYTGLYQGMKNAKKN